MYGLVIHGGAGTLPRAEMAPAREAEYRDGLATALAQGFDTLAAGGSSLDAAVRAVTALEDNPLFNAGRGAVYTLDGHHELDASVMEGTTRRAGAVCGVRHVRNPVALARAVMEHSPYVLLAAEGAEEFALEQGMALVPESYFHTEARLKQLERIREGDRSLSPLTISHLGTVGAVALDQRGGLAAATSTGGISGKRYRRVGDSPIVGAGSYADDRGCAVSTTGLGECFIRAAVAHDICARVRYGGRTLAGAVRELIHEELPSIGGTGGVIAIDAQGHIALEFNTEGMFRASQIADGSPSIRIYRERG